MKGEPFTMDLIFKVLLVTFVVGSFFSQKLSAMPMEMMTMNLPLAYLCGHDLERQLGFVCGKSIPIEDDDCCYGHYCRVPLLQAFCDSR